MRVPLLDLHGQMVPLREEILAAVTEVIDSTQYILGPKVEQFEKNIAAYCGSGHGIGVASGTDALLVSLMALGIGPGDAVLTTPYSFFATMGCILRLGAKPVFVDIDPVSYNIDPERMAEALEQDGRAGKRIKAIIPVHLYGQCADMGSILALARQYGLPVVEDAACAIGSEISPDNGTTWEKIGRPHSAVACFSFHPRKVLTTGDGGMLTTNDPKLDSQFRLWRQHGMGLSDLARHGASTVVFEEYLTTGYNYRLTDIQAAVGIEQLKKLPGMVAERRNIAAHYQELLRDVPGIILPSEPTAAKTNWQSYPVRLKAPTNKSQQNFMQLLQNKGVACRRGIMNAHQEPPYAQAGWRLPHSEACRDQILLLPLFCGLEEASQLQVARAVMEVCAL